jgi:hypothetical protein
MFAAQPRFPYLGRGCELRLLCGAIWRLKKLQSTENSMRKTAKEALSNAVRLRIRYLLSFLDAPVITSSPQLF